MPSDWTVCDKSVFRLTYDHGGGEQWRWANQKSPQAEQWQQRNIRRRNARERSYVCSNEEAFFCPGLKQSPCHCALNFSWALAAAQCTEDHGATKQNVLHRHPTAFMPSPSWSCSSTWSRSLADYCLIQNSCACVSLPTQKGEMENTLVHRSAC